MGIHAVLQTRLDSGFLEQRMLFVMLGNYVAEYLKPFIFHLFARIGVGA